MKGIADTGFLVAFANRHDQHHDWAVSVASRVTEPLLTCEAVLAEAAFHLRDSVDRSDFRIYRRNKRETIPLICPPVK